MICLIIDGLAAINNARIPSDQVRGDIFAGKHRTGYVLPPATGERDCACDQDDSIPLKSSMDRQVPLHKKYPASARSAA